MSDDLSPEEIFQRGFIGEIQRHYSSRSEVQDMMKPLSEKLDKHLGYHEGMKVTWTLAIPLICVLVSATAILIAALV